MNTDLMPEENDEQEREMNYVCVWEREREGEGGRHVISPMINK